MPAGEGFERPVSRSPQDPVRGGDPLADAIDRRFMGEALRLAARLPRRPWPNPPVGAVVVREGRVVGRGAHRGPGTEHAETAALAEAGDRARGATLYCTLEPCNHRGRTPPCAPAVAAAGLARVVVALRDPNPTVGGGGLAVLRRAGLEVALGVGGAEALDLIWPFAATGAFGRPYVLLKTATSLDGRFAPDLPAADGEPARPRYLTGPEARAEVHRLRRWLDLVLVGEGTLEADRPRLDGRLVGPRDDCPEQEPQAGYLDTDLSWRGAWKPEGHLVFCGERGAPPAARRERQAAGARVVPCRERDGRLDLRGVVAEAFRLGFPTLMFEGGPRLAASLLAEGLVDRWVHYLAPVALGGGVGWAPARPGPGGPAAFHLTAATRVGPDLRTVWDREPFAARLRELTAPA